MEQDLRNGMKQLGFCCQNRIDAHCTEPPFSRIIGTDWYDGLLSGFAECSSCRKAYWFSVIAWDVLLSERVYAFMALGDDQFDRVVQTLHALGSPPKWPVWIPIWNFPGEQKSIAERMIGEVNAGAGPTSYIVSAEDLALRIVCVHKLENEEDIIAVKLAVGKGEDMPSRDELLKWLAFLRRSSQHE